MYCSKCGEADQNPNSYCRKCGNYLNTQKQITFSLTMNIISFVVSLSLILFLMGYANGVELAGKSMPNMSGFYIFLGLNAILQLISLVYSIKSVMKIDQAANKTHVTSEEKQTEFKNLDTEKDLLPPADLQSVIPSVIEQTTKNLEKVERN
jgi:uncharacterized membrane protein (DUF485 family)